MRIATSALVSMAVALTAARAAGQPVPPPLPPPMPQPVPPPTPPAVPRDQPAQGPGAPPPAAPPSAPPSPSPVVPPPPPPGGPSELPPAPPPPAVAFPVEASYTAGHAEPPLAGWNDLVFVRDARDRVRLYPGVRMDLDLNTFFGRGVSDVPAANGGTALKTRLFLRRARLEFDGEFFHRWSFELQGELGGDAVQNPSGVGEAAAAPAGVAPDAATARYAPVQSVGAAAALADAWINYSLCPCLNFMFGQFEAPFSMENTTRDPYLPRMERNLAIHGFAFPTVREIGTAIWGDVDPVHLTYTLGAFLGDGQNRVQVDNRFDFIGRIWIKPFAGPKNALENAHIGVSAKHGDRDQASVGYDYPTITTGQGWQLWKPTYRDSFGRLVHVLPSGAQNEIGGELRIPVGRVELRGEGYYVVNDTREAVDGYQLTNTERLGRMKGVSWYVQLSAWPMGDAFIVPDPGLGPRPKHVDLRKEPEIKRGVELVALFGGINASYDGATRTDDTGTVSRYDDATPGGPKGPSSTITVYELGLGANYWHTRHLRLSLDYTLYDTPKSGSKDNQAAVPGNTVGTADEKLTTHVMHEVGARMMARF